MNQRRPTQLAFDLNAGQLIGLRHGTAIAIEPVDATFRDSARAPLHSWFPYLEGYSPRFVEAVRHEYMPDARRIIDPFAGSGTTPIVLAQAGIECAYSEANPAMAFVIATKLAALGLPPAERSVLAATMRKLSGELRGCAAACRPDESLMAAYSASFGPSIFFEDDAMQAFLRLRSLNDEVAAQNPLLGNCMSLAVLAALIPSSLLKRAGDLRFKTRKEIALGLPDPVKLVADRLLSQAADLLVAGAITCPAIFAADTARELANHMEPVWDGVITSPPYLNGTNYIRNARLELWYLRQIATKSDLRALRDRVVTSGINDVDANTSWAAATDSIQRVVDELVVKAYDDRIAKMVGGYFADMREALQSLMACTRRGARLCIDIGDSIYAGVHVPTDDLLVDLAESLGLNTVERVHLRKRVSKNGSPVRQQLLVFENRRAVRPSRIPDPSSAGLRDDWQIRWAIFKATLPHQLPPYSKREWGGPAHSMCSYQGKMKPALAHHLIECFTAPGAVVVDPFSGAGTIPFEACRMGRKGHGLDISRLGHVLTFGKTGMAQPDAVEAMLRRLEAYVATYEVSERENEQAAAIRFNSAVPDYFHPDTLREVLAARVFFASEPETPEWAMIFASTLHLLHGNRPYALSRRSHPVTPFKPTGPFEYRALMPRLREKLARMAPELSGSTRQYGASAQADCTTTWPLTIPMADAIITSPPFFDSTRFYMANWMRFWFAGWERADFDVKPRDYLETRQKQSLEVYRDFFGAARERMIDGGLLVMHLGQSPKCDMGEELARRVDPWFSVADCFTEGVEHCESHGIRDKGTVSGHTYLVLVAH
jgi:DNA modification methylase